MSSLYERLGGEDGLTAAVTLFYEKALADGRVARFFDHLDMSRLIEKQIAFMTIAFGGPSGYETRDLTEAHRGVVARGAGDGEFDALVELLRETLREMSVADALIAEAAAVVEGMRGHVLGREGSEGA